MLEARIEKRVAGFHLQLELMAGKETIALLGASGAGKTMTLQCLAGLVKPDRGYIALDGHVWLDSEKHIFVPPQERGVGLLFQNYALFPNMTVRQNLLCGLRRDTPRDEREAEVRRMLERFCLTGLENRMPAQLSGGQQQRVALARCLARKPRLLLLDEPFAALDTHLRWRLEQELMDTLAGFEGTTVYVTHDREETRRLCQRVCVMHGGRAQAAVATGEWYHRPATKSAAQLAGFENVTDVTLQSNGRAHLDDWGADWPCAEPRATAVAFRAEDAGDCSQGKDFVILCRMIRVTEQEAIGMPVDRPSSLIRARADKRFIAGELACISVRREKIVWLRQEE